MIGPVLIQPVKRNITLNQPGLCANFPQAHAVVPPGGAAIPVVDYEAGVSGGGGVGVGVLVGRRMMVNTPVQVGNSGPEVIICRVGVSVKVGVRVTVAVGSSGR